MTSSDVYRAIDKLGNTCRQHATPPAKHNIDTAGTIDHLSGLCAFSALIIGHKFRNYLSSLVQDDPMKKEPETANIG